MRSKEKALEFIRKTWLAIVGNPDADVPKIILLDSDEYHTPYVKKYWDGIEAAIIAIYFPLRYWRDVKESILMPTIPCELVNCFLNENTPMEVAMRKEISDVEQKYENEPEALAKEINLILRRYEEELHIGDVELARKLTGDESVYYWMIKANYDPRWTIDLFELLIKEAPEYFQPHCQIVDGLKKRIAHFQFLINGNTEAAENIRNEQSALAEQRLATFPPLVA